MAMQVQAAEEAAREARRQGEMELQWRRDMDEIRRRMRERELNHAKEMKRIMERQVSHEKKKRKHKLNHTKELKRIVASWASSFSTRPEERDFVTLLNLTGESQLETWESQLRASLAPYKLFRYLCRGHRQTRRGRRRGPVHLDNRPRRHLQVDHSVAEESNHLVQDDEAWLEPRGRRPP